MIDFFRVTPRKRKIKLNRRKGVLFSNPGNFKKIIFYSGTWLFVLSVIYAFYLYIPILNAYGRYWVSQQYESNGKTVNIVPTPIPQPVSDQKKEYTISIPKILAFSKIVDNISPFDSRQYLEVLNNDVVAQAKNTAYPGSGKGQMTYIFAHSTNQGISMMRNNAVFYLLGELKNDDVIFINRNGISYTYRVYKQLIVNADKIEYLRYTEPDKEILILQTCWPIGTDWKRLLVLAKLVDN